MTEVEHLKFRSDIEGMRAVAIILVVLAHLSVPGFSGGFIGVDVFFVISGYLITALLVREYESSSTIQLTRFFANRLRCLMPALLTMLLVSSAISIAFEPELRQIVQSLAKNKTDDFLCHGGWCKAIRNDFIVYRDENYLTASFAASMVSYFHEKGGAENSTDCLLKSDESCDILDIPLQ